MKFVSFIDEDRPRLGLFVNESVYDLNQINPFIANNMAEFLRQGEDGMSFVKLTEKQILEGRFEDKKVKDFVLTAPVPEPTSLRDACAFRAHVAAVYKSKGEDIIPEFEHFPIFYFSNHQSIKGPGPIECMPDHLNKLDFELEVAIVLNKRGKNISAKDAHTYVAGFMIMNDFSARDLQMKEMKLNLGPAKGKDFATAIGPYLVTLDEIESYKSADNSENKGLLYNLKMTASVNGKKVSDGNSGDMSWSFAEILERVSYGVEVFPGDIIGSGTVGTGCFLELNGAPETKTLNKEEQWLKPGDQVDLEIEGLGKLTNTIVESS